MHVCDALVPRGIGVIRPGHVHGGLPVSSP